jgi:uncharacterized membrane-anchored protein
MQGKKNDKDFEKFEIKEGIETQSYDTVKKYTILAIELKFVRDTTPARSSDDRYNDYTLYFTKKGNYIVYEEQISRWQNESNIFKIHMYKSLQEVVADFAYFNSLLDVEVLDF